MSQQASVFISYRRSDAAGHAGRLFDRLRLWFDVETLFYDLGSIESGELFPPRIEAAVSSAKVVLVLIGPDWLAEINRRAALPALDANLPTVDFVRVEVELALRLHASKGCPTIIPVLLGGAKAPSLADLHETLRAGLQQLPAHNAHEFQGQNADWDHQFVRLRELIVAVPAVPAARYRPPTGEPRPFRVIDHLLSPHFRDPTGALARVRETLLVGGNAAIVVPAALYGMGGVGKTQLALKYSHEYRDSYAGIWWFRAESDKTLLQDARAACLEVGAVIADGEPPTATFNRWLRGQGERWLVVFDNAESATALRPHLPQAGPHHVLITSRDPAWGGMARPIVLAVWSEEEGAEFLAARLPVAGRGDLQRLSRTLGGLQLALEQAAAFLEQTGGSVADYCTQIEGVDTAALILDEGRASTGYEQSVLATLSLAFPRLGVAAQQLLRICAFFSAEPIPERYFRDGADFLPEALAVATRQTLTWERTVGGLRRFGIVERIDVASLDRTPGQPDERLEKALVLHRLTLEVARHALSVPAEDGPRAQRLLRTHCPNKAGDPHQWPRFAVLLPHLFNLERLSSQGWLNRRMHSGMLDRTAHYLRDAISLYQESERVFRSALELDKADVGDEHPDTLAAMGNLALTLGAQGDLSDARMLQEQVLLFRRRVSGGEHPDTLTSMGNLALTLGAQGDLSGARTLQEQVLLVRRRVLSDEHPDTLTAMSNLAHTLGEQGDRSGARVLQEQVLLVRRRALDEEHPDTLTSMSNLAHTLGEQGDRSGARVLQEQVLLVRRRVLGEEHPDTLTSMGNLAFTLGAQGDRSGARALQEQVLLVRRRVFGEEHPDTLTAMGNLAFTLGVQGDRSGARALQEQVLLVRRRVSGEEHPDTLTAMSNLAHTLGAQGDRSGARVLQEQVLLVRRRALSEEHPDTLRSMSNFASTLGAQGDRSGARALQEQVLLVRRRVLGEEHPDTLTSMGNLASTLGEQGDRSGARVLQEQVLLVRRRVLGEEHPDTLTSMGNLASTLGEQGDRSGARVLQEQVLLVRRRVFGEEHPDTLTSMNNLAVTLWRQGDLNGARALEEQVLLIRRRVLGEEHPDTLTSMNNLAVTLWRQGDLNGARALEEQVLLIRRRVLGEEHPDTLTSMNNLAYTLWQLGARDKAETLMAVAVEGRLSKLGAEHPETQNSLDALATWRAARN